LSANVARWGGRYRRHTVVLAFEDYKAKREVPSTERYGFQLPRPADPTHLSISGGML
jgi:hypothetical protein